MFRLNAYPPNRNRFPTNIFSPLAVFMIVSVLIVDIAYAESFRTFQSEKYGFSAQFPDTWKYKVNKEGDMVFTSEQVPGGAIVIQFISKAANKGSSTKKKLVGIW